MDPSKVIEKAYSSKLRIEQRDNKTVIIKSVDAQECKNEIAFHELLRQLEMPFMEIHEEQNELVITFLENSETLDDSETPERYIQLGKALKTLHAQEYQAPFWIDAQGEKHAIKWADFIKKQIKYGRTRQQERQSMSEEVVERIAKAITHIKQPQKTVPIHGDLHANNVLIQDDRMYLFDKADQIFAGDPMYDLSSFGITLPGIYGIGTQTEKDAELMNALMEGYGENILNDRATFDRYVLLRALERWPNPFEQEIPELVNTILERLARS